MPEAISAVASTRVQGWGDEPCEPTVRLPDWSEFVASYSRMKSAWGRANGGQPILFCYIRKYVIILGGYSRWCTLNQKIGGICPRHPRRGWRQCQAEYSVCSVRDADRMYCRSDWCVSLASTTERPLANVSTSRCSEYCFSNPTTIIFFSKSSLSTAFICRKDRGTNWESVAYRFKIR